MQVKEYYLMYRRAESFRKALAYQKHYLILLLGGFQDCEDVTLALIARIGTAQPHSDTVNRVERSLSPLARFRRAAMVAIAARRLVMLWKRWVAARMRACTVPGNNNDRV